jgi:hypothetical protein
MSSPEYVPPGTPPPVGSQTGLLVLDNTANNPILVRLAHGHTLDMDMEKLMQRNHTVDLYLSNRRNSPLLLCNLLKASSPDGSPARSQRVRSLVAKNGICQGH